jgi:TFIIF-interacting CTD phosphatase-like protein
LKKVKRRGYNLESIIAVDDTPRKWEQSYENLIAVKPVEGDECDRELPHLLIYLNTLTALSSNMQYVISPERGEWGARSGERSYFTIQESAVVGSKKYP